jgi:hypothetical protein
MTCMIITTDIEYAMVQYSRSSTTITLVLLKRIPYLLKIAKHGEHLNFQHLSKVVVNKCNNIALLELKYQ